MRNLKVSVVIGALSAVVALLLSATGLFVLLDVPLAKALNIPVDGRAIGGTPWFTILIFAFGIAWTAVDITRPALRRLVAGVSVVLLGTWSLVLALDGHFFSPLAPVVAVACSSCLGLAWGRTKRGMRQQVLERLFGQRLPQAAFRSIIASRMPVDFPGRVMNASVLVVTVQNHAELMELLPPESYTAMTNLYLKTASDYLVESGAYLDECNGECLRVVFGAPLEDERHAVKALSLIHI